MSRPYLNVQSATYSSQTFSMNLDYLRLSGGVTFSVTGLSSSVITFGVTNSYSPVSSTGVVTGVTFSLHTALGTGILLGTYSVGTQSVGYHYLYNVGLTFSIPDPTTGLPVIIETYGFTFSS